MPVTEVKGPDGTIHKVKHPEGATKPEIIAFAKQKAEASYSEAALTVGSAALTEPVAGIVGAGVGALTQDPRAAEHVINKVREWGTYQPRTAAGQAGLQNVASAVEPVANALGAAERTLGEGALELTGSPTLAAAAHSIPTALLEVIGLAGAKGATNVKRAGSMPKTKPSTAAQWESVKFVREKGINPVDESGQFTKEAMELIAANVDEVERRVKGVLSPEELENYNLFSKRGVEPTKANLTRKTDDWRNQKDAEKRGGSVSEVVAGQDRRLAELAEEGIAGTGATADDLPSTNNSIFSAIDGSASASEQLISEAYAVARQRAGVDGRVVTLDDLATSLRSGEDNVTRGVIGAIRSELEHVGVIAPDGRLTNKRLTVNEAESVRQYMNELWPETKGVARKRLRTFKQMLDEDVATAVGEDVFADARKANSDYMRTIERSKRDHRDKSRASLLEDILENKVDEGQIYNKLINARPDDFKTVKNFLSSTTEGQQAFQNFKAQVLREALTKATGHLGRADGGVPIFKANQFSKAFAKMRVKGEGGGSLYSEIFSAKERALIEDIERISELRIPSANVAQGSGPSGYQMARNALRRMPVMGEKLADELDDIADKATVLNPASGTNRYFRSSPGEPRNQQ